MWCPTTSQRGRGGRGRAFSWCSPSWRRQCCPADRRCTEFGKASGHLGLCFLCMLRSEAGRTMKISFLDGTEMTWWPMWRKSTQRGRTKEHSWTFPWTSSEVYKDHVRLSRLVFFFFFWSNWRLWKLSKMSSFPLKLDQRHVFENYNTIRSCQCCSHQVFSLQKQLGCWKLDSKITEVCFHECANTLSI